MVKAGSVETLPFPHFKADKHLNSPVPIFQMTKSMQKLSEKKQVIQCMVLSFEDHRDVRISTDE